MDLPERFQIVFPAPIVAAASAKDYFVLRTREYAIAPQGQSKLPASGKEANSAGALSMMSALSSIGKDSFVIAGMGTVTYRKGVDVFIAVAADLFRQFPETDCRFIWIGHTLSIDLKYKEYLHQQIEKCGLGGRVVLIDEVTDLGPLPRRMRFCSVHVWIRFRTSPSTRALRGLPIVCFEKASGIAEILAEDSETREKIDCSIPRCSRRRARHSRTDRQQEAAGKYFEIASKAGQGNIQHGPICRRAGPPGARLHRGKETKGPGSKGDPKSGVFDPNLCFGTDAPEQSLPDSIARYLQQSRLARPLARARSGLFFRRPMVGFNPDLCFGLSRISFIKTGSARAFPAIRPAGRPLDTPGHRSGATQARKRNPASCGWPCTDIFTTRTCCRSFSSAFRSIAAKWIYS